jgi:hypothetical protein
MTSKEELLDTINEIKQKEPTYANCEKLATFYTLLRYLYSEETGQSYSAGVFPATNGSEFRQAIAGKDIEKVVDVLDEHMEVVMILFPKEYKEVIRRIREEG